MILCLSDVQMLFQFLGKPRKCYSFICFSTSSISSENKEFCEESISITTLINYLGGFRVDFHVNGIILVPSRLRVVRCLDQIIVLGLYSYFRFLEITFLPGTSLLISC